MMSTTIVTAPIAATKPITLNKFGMENAGPGWIFCKVFNFEQFSGR